MAKSVFLYYCAIIIILVSSFSISTIAQRTARQPKVAYDNGVENVQDLSKYLQPNDLLSGKYDYQQPGKYRCARDCSLYPESRLCYHKFVVEQYHVMGPACDGCPEDENACYRTHCACADGIEKTILTINRQLCSPAIMVCEGDRVVMDVLNKMPARTTSIHSHGVHFRGCPWFDGAAHVTQCPIIEGQTFRYAYTMRQAGDFLYHSHDSTQMMDGIQGPLISRSPTPDPHADEYDEDIISHTMYIQDWMHVLTDVKLPGYNKAPQEDGFDHVNNYLINGRGSYTRKDGTRTNTPFAVFNVVQGKRYRFRIVSSMNMPAIFSIEDHDFTLITMDLDPIRSKRASSLFLTTGERYGIIISANKQPRSYWIQVKDFDSDTRQYAILRYIDENGQPIKKGSSMSTPPKRPLKYNTPTLNDVSDGCDPTNTTAICVDQLEALSPTPLILLQTEPDYRLFLSPSFHYFDPKELYVKGVYYKYYIPMKGPSIGGGIFSDMYNNVTLSMPPFAMLTQNDPFPRDSICGEECFKPDTHCECTPIYKIPLGAVVEIVITDGTLGGAIYHSHHLHGYSFRVIKQGKSDEMENNPNFYRNLITTDYRLYPLRDTIVVPYEGYAIIRFWATNPGMWMIHCHVSSHIHMGMAAVIQIGERYEFPEPPEEFPTCGNFVPNVRFT